MSFQLRAVDRTKLYSAIVEQILEGVRSGAFPPQSALPAERVLAAELGVSRASVREAIRVLEHAGVLDVRTGSGTYVSSDGLSKGAALRAHAVLLGDHSPLDVVIARRAVEPTCAEQAAQHRRAAELKVLHGLVDEHEALERSGKDPAEPDLAFHVAIASASHNPVLAMLMERLAELMRQSTWRTFRQHQLRRPGRGEEMVTQHRSILAAIEGGDREGASRRMHEHLDAVEAGLLAEVDAASPLPADPEPDELQTSA